MEQPFLQNFRRASCLLLSPRARADRDLVCILGAVGHALRFRTTVLCSTRPRCDSTFPMAIYRGVYFLREEDAVPLYCLLRNPYPGLGLRAPWPSHSHLDNCPCNQSYCRGKKTGPRPAADDSWIGPVPEVCLNLSCSKESQSFVLAYKGNSQRMGPPLRYHIAGPKRSLVREIHVDAEPISGLTVPPLVTSAREKSPATCKPVQTWFWMTKAISDCRSISLAVQSRCSCVKLLMYLASQGLNHERNGELRATVMP